MAEFTGDQFITLEDGSSYYSGAYVDWLEGQIEALKAELAKERASNTSLRDAIHRQVTLLSPVPSRLAAEEYADRCIENTEDLDDYYGR